MSTEQKTGRILSIGGKTAIYDDKGKLVKYKVLGVQWVHGNGALPSMLLEVDMASIDAEGKMYLTHGGKIIQKITFIDGSEEVFLPAKTEAAIFSEEPAIDGSC